VFLFQIKGPLQWADASNVGEHVSIVMTEPMNEGTCLMKVANAKWHQPFYSKARDLQVWANAQATQSLAPSNHTWNNWQGSRYPQDNVGLHLGAQTFVLCFDQKSQHHQFRLQHLSDHKRCLPIASWVESGNCLTPMRALLYWNFPQGVMIIYKSLGELVSSKV
jgi:hypothetical protein